MAAKNKKEAEKETRGKAAGAMANQELVSELFNRKAGLSKAALRISQALDAKETKVFSFQGLKGDSVELTDHKTRLTAAKMVVDINDAMPSKKVDVTFNHEDALDELI